MNHGLIGHQDDMVIVERQEFQGVEATGQEFELGPALDIIRAIPVYDTVSVHKNNLQISALIMNKYLTPF